MQGELKQYGSPPIGQNELAIGLTVNTSLPRLQRIILQLQKYDLEYRESSCQIHQISPFVLL